MTAATTAQRVYEALKHRLVSGAMLPGERLEPRRLAQDLASSVTPVREALHRLRGEQLVEARPSSGFSLPLVTESGLRDLYRWNGDLLQLAIRAWRREPLAPQLKPPRASAPAAIGMVFAAIAARAGNAEFEMQIAVCNDRLGAARAAEPYVVDAIGTETDALAAACERGNASELARLVRAYHRRRDRAAPQIARAIYHPDLASEVL